MSAQEIIEKIKALPREEQRQVFNFVKQVQSDDEPAATVRYVDDASFAGAATRVFETHDELFKRLAK